MKAIVQNAYGSPEILEYKEVDTPAIKENDILVNVQAAAVNAGDVFSLRGSPWLARFSVGFPKPKDYILGWDAAGKVEAVGSKVIQFKPGDEVYGGCSHAFAEFVSADADNFAMKPASLTFEQAAAVPTAAVAALQGLRDKGKISSGRKVLINGASGGVGTFAVQIAKALGAEVTGVCSIRNADMVRTLGADHVIIYTQEDFTRSDERYDLILDNAGHRSFAALRRLLKPGGIIVPNSGHGGMGYVFKAFLLAPFIRQQGRPFLAVPNRKDLDFLTELIEAGKVKPVIDKTFPLCEASKAFTYLEEEHARGKVVIQISESA